MSFPKYADYKASGFGWAAELPGHWDSASLKWLCGRYSGGTPDKNKPAFWEGGTIPWLNSGAVNDGRIYEASAYITQEAFENSSAKWIPPGALVMALAGQGKTKGMVAQLMFASTCNQSMAALVPSERINAKFLYWWLVRNYQNIRNMAGGDLRDGLNLDLLGEIPCPLPLLAEQTNIAAFLDRETAKIDTLITQQEKLIALLAEKRQATISHAVTKGINPDVPMKESGVTWLGELPAHWEVKRMKQLVQESIAGPYGSSLTKAMYTTSGYRVYGQQQVIPDNFAVGDYYISNSQFTEMARYRVKPGDVLVSVMGTIGQAAVVPPDVEPGIINPRLVLYRVNEQLILPRYMQSVLNSSRSQKYFSLAAQGTTMEGLNMTSIGELYVALPPLNEQRELLEFVQREGDRLDALSVEVMRALALLKERRSALIAAAVTGQIDVCGAMPHTEFESPEAIAA